LKQLQRGNLLYAPAIALIVAGKPKKDKEVGKMKILRALALLSCFGLLLVAFAPSAQASEMDKKTIVTVSAPFQLPGGVVLPQGEYVFKTPVADPKVVQVMNRNETKVYATILTNSIERPRAKGKTEIDLGEAPAGQPVPIEAWFYPGRTIGWEFPPANR
jgi:hypothetical protein